MHHAYAVSKRINFLSTDRVKKLVDLHGNLRNTTTSSCNRLAGASAKPGSSLLNCISEIKCNKNCCLCQFSNNSDYVFSISITDITEYYHFITDITELQSLY